MNRDHEQHYPLISVVTPTFNRARFVVEAVESVLRQDYPNIEHIVVDDGSTDDTRDRLQPYIDDGRVVYIEQPNQGQSVARNQALKRAQGDLICFLDSDNLWLEGKLTTQVDVLNQNPDVDLVYGDKTTIDEDGREINRKNIGRHSGFITHQLLKDNCVSINTVMMRRRCYDEMGGFNERDRLAEDYDLWLRYSTRYRFLYVPEYFASYRVMEDQISTDKDARFWANIRTLSQFCEQFPDAFSSKEYRQGWAALSARKARYDASRQRRLKALIGAVSALRYWPFNSTGWRALYRVIFAK